MQRSSWHGVLIWALGALAVTFVAIMAINQAVLRPLARQEHTACKAAVSV